MRSGQAVDRQRQAAAAASSGGGATSAHLRRRETQSPERRGARPSLRMPASAARGAHVTCTALALRCRSSLWRQRRGEERACPPIVSRGIPPRGWVGLGTQHVPRRSRTPSARTPCAWAPSAGACQPPAYAPPVGRGQWERSERAAACLSITVRHTGGPVRTVHPTSASLRGIGPKDLIRLHTPPGAQL